MRIVRFQSSDRQIQHGVLDDQTISAIDGDLFGQWTETDTTYELADVHLLAPVWPMNILAIGKNYKAHAEESGGDVPSAPLLFIKASTSLNHPNAPIVLPKVAPNEVDFEAELAVVIGRTARHVSETEALDHVLGYTCGHDVSARDCQMGDGQWARGKSFDTFCPLGPWIETDLDPSNLRICGRLNGEAMQDSNTSLMVFNVPYLISYLSMSLTLVPGTVIMTGTPDGVGFARKPPVFLKAGDVYEIDIEGIGVLSNPVIEAT